MAFKDFLLENRIKVLLNHYNGKSQSKLHEIFDNITDFSNDQILNLYIEFVFKKGELGINEYQKIISKNASKDKLLSDNVVANYLAQNITNYLNNELFPNADVILDLLNNEKVRNEVMTLMPNVQQLGMNLLRNNPIDFKTKLEILKKIGFKLDLDFNRDHSIIFNETIQENLMTQGLITPEVVSQMYKYKYETLKEAVKKQYGAFSHMPISPKLMPLPDDKMANYWREQAEQLGFDALAHIMTTFEYKDDNNTFSEENMEDFVRRVEASYIPRKEIEERVLFSQDGLPTNGLFNNQKYGNSIHKILYHNWEDRGNDKIFDFKLLQYFIKNIDKIEDKNFRGMLKVCASLIPEGSISYIDDEPHFSVPEVRETLLKFINFATGGHRIDSNMFDENGISDKFYEIIINNPESYDLLPLLDPEWEKHYDKRQKNYMQASAKIPRLRRFLFYIPWPKNHSDVIEYFDENGLNDDFYKGLLYMLPHNWYILDQIGEEWKKHYTQKELNYMEIAKRNSLIQSILCHGGVDVLVAIETYVLEEPNRLNPKIFKRCFDSKEWDLILEFSTGNDLNILNEFELKALTEYKKISTANLKVIFRDFVMNYKSQITLDKMEMIATLLSRLEYSNAGEIANFKESLATQLIGLENPLIALEQIEEVFLKNNLPIVGKIYSVFEILHPNATGFDYSSQTISPVLKNVGARERSATIFADLLKASLGSNNHSIREYLENIEMGNEIFQKLSSGEFSFDQLEPIHVQILSTYLEHLNILYNNTLAGKLQSEPSKLTGNIEADMQNLVRLFSESGELDYNMPDRIVKMFGFFAGINTFEEAKKYFIERPQMADKRNREKAEKGFELEIGDFVKGINELKYLPNILQNGSVAKEFLGDCASSDATPLDTDLSQIQELSGTVEETLANTAAFRYGKIWLILKNDARFYTTRTHEGTIENVDQRSHRDQLEVFYTGVLGNGHYGIRTGFASTEIDYIMCEEYDKRIGMEIAKNGFYIPVVDKSGKIVFSAKDYDEIRAQMGGLEYYQAGPFNYSESLVSEGTLELADQIPDNIVETRAKREAINTAIADVIRKLNLELKTTMDGNLTEGSVELIDTGSTARGTNMIGDGDFDLLMRVDKTILLNPEKLNALKEALKEALADAEKHDMTSSGDFRYKKVNIPGLDIPVDIDITFAQKTNKTTYSTEMALNERLASIQNDSPKQYALVAANIIMAKKFLKEAGCYKPNRGEVPQGGLGGVGIENWILANGGSFEQAARSFLTAAEGKPFEEFRKSYGVYDFGQNHMATKTGDYPYDNFVTRNMSAEGFEKMQAALKQYLLTLEQEKEMKK